MEGRILRTIRLVSDERLAEIKKQNEGMGEYADSISVDEQGVVTLNLSASRYAEAQERSEKEIEEILCRNTQ